MRTLLVVLSIPVLALAQAPDAAPPAAPAAVAAAVLLGSGEHTYRWVPDWAGVPMAKTGDTKDTAAKNLGNTHGCMVVDGQGNLLVNTDTANAVVVFAPDGSVRRTWGEDFRGGLHGMCHRIEDGSEVLYLAHTGRHEVVKTTLDGKVLWTLGWPEASGVYEKEDQYKPTAVAVAPDGRLFVADGYGRSWVHVYDRDRNYLKSFGGRGSEPGQMQTPHGLWLDARGEQPLLCVCDRENHRLQWFTMAGEFVRLMDKDLRRPCNVWPLPDSGLVVADLAGRISILGKDDVPMAHLGDNPDPKKRAQNGVPRELWRDGEFLSPHSVCADAAGNLYVMDWNSLGRITKLEKVVAAKKQ